MSVVTYNLDAQDLFFLSNPSSTLVKGFQVNLCNTGIASTNSIYIVPIGGGDRIYLLKDQPLDAEGGVIDLQNELPPRYNLHISTTAELSVVLSY